LCFPALDEVNFFQFLLLLIFMPLIAVSVLASAFFSAGRLSLSNCSKDLGYAMRLMSCQSMLKGSKPVKQMAEIGIWSRLIKLNRDLISRREYLSKDLNYSNKWPFVIQICKIDSNSFKWRHD